MDMKHGLACLGVTVEDRAITALLEAMLAGNNGSPANQRADQDVVTIGKVIHCGDVTTWNDQYVEGSLGRNISERE